MRSFDSVLALRARLALIRATSCLGLIVAITIASPSTCSAQEDPPDIVRIEEDWELAIAAPDPVADVPQVVCVFGPSDPNGSLYAVFELNHASLPDFAAGGMQLQCWYDSYVLGYDNHTHHGEFEASVDYVTFTTVTRMHDDHMHLQIINGNSITWGEFGGESNLNLRINTWRNNFNDYDPEFSIANSRVTFGANRVNRFVRREVRYYSADGLYQTDEEDKYVHQLVVDDPSEGPEEATE
ncbi:MAG: hypothetical protein KDA86_12920 [Planctomycetaceae bacterium]|nr:hypothetical protein [Planctomycetaceae bacterium]